MDLLASKKTAEVLLRLSGKNDAPLSVPMRVQKPPFGTLPESVGALPRAFPEAVGLDSRVLLEFLRRASAREHNLHSLLVVRRGRVVLDCAFAPYDNRVWHVTHSLAKTVTALAIGILTGEGRLSLDTPAEPLLRGKAQALGRSRWKGLTVRHLLTMTSGLAFNEIATVTQTDWLRGAFDGAPQFEPGAQFSYNSLNTYLLSAVVRAVTGQTLAAFLRTRLFEPMGIRRFHMETCPMGVEKGGWGMYFLPEDMAKLGVLCASGGSWGGRQLVPANFLRELARKQSAPPESMSDYGYGLHAWLWARPGSFLMNGLFGQNVLVLPDLEAVVVSTAGSSRLFGKSGFLSLCEEYFGKNAIFPQKSPPRPAAALRLKMACRAQQNAALRFPGSALRRRSDAAQNAEISGKAFALAPQSARLLPLFMQVFEHNYTAGLSRCAFRAVGERLVCTLWEGAERNAFEIGLVKPARAVLRANGEEQLAAVCGRWTENEDGVPVLLVHIAFLEQSSSRKLKFFFLPDGTMRLRLSEIPAREALGDGVSAVVGSSRILSMLSDAIGEKRIEQQLDAIAEPELTGMPLAAHGLSASAPEGKDGA